MADLTTGRRRRRDLLRGAGAALVGLAALTACGGASASVGAATNASAATSASAAAASSAVTSARVSPPTASAAQTASGSVHLTATNWSDVSIAAIYQKLFAQFQQEHQTITVDFVATPDNYFPKLLTEAAGGVLHDVFWMNAQNLGAWVAKGQLLDLTPLIGRDHYSLDDFWKAKIDAATVGGKVMVLPSQADDIGVYYNADMFQKANAKPPSATYADQSWDRQAFLDACQQFTKAQGSGTGAQYGCVVPTAFTNYAPWIWSGGGSFMNADRTASTVTDPATVEAFQFLQDLINKYHVAPTPAELSAQSGDTLFATGKVAMTTNTIAGTTFYRKNATAFAWDAGGIPAGNGGFATLSAGPFWAIAAHNAHTDQAWTLATYLVSADTQRALAQQGAEMPSRKSIATEVWAKPTQPPMHGNSFLAGMDHIHPNPFVPTWSQIETMMTKELSYLWDGSKPAQQVMQAIAPQMDTLIQRKPS